jgi:hypothetical protein
LADTSVRDRYCLQVRQHVQQHHGVDDMTQRFVELYRSIVDA